MVKQYAIAFFLGFAVSLIPLYLIVFGVVGSQETGEGNSSLNCWHFENQREAQAFYDAVRDPTDPDWYS